MALPRVCLARGNSIVVAHQCSTMYCSIRVRFPSLSLMLHLMNVSLSVSPRVMLADGMLAWNDLCHAGDCSIRAPVSFIFPSFVYPFTHSFSMSTSVSTLPVESDVQLIPALT